MEEDKCFCEWWTQPLFYQKEGFMHLVNDPQKARSSIFDPFLFIINLSSCSHLYSAKIINETKQPQVIEKDSCYSIGLM